MAKSTGLGDNFFVGGYDLSGDTASLSNIGGGPEALEVTGIDKSAVERIGGLRTGGMSWSSWFNKDAKQQHVALSPLPTTDVQVMYFRGTTLGNAAAACVAKQINYDPTRGADGSLTFDVDVESNGFGLEWGTMVTPGIETDTAAADGTGVENAAQASTNFGLQAYLQTFDFTGTDVTVKLQESSDDGADAYADITGGGFTQITSGDQHTERLATATNLTVEQFVRAITITTGGFSAFEFAVMFVRNEAVPVF